MLATAGCDRQQAGVTLTQIRQISWSDTAGVLHPTDLVVVDDRIYLSDRGLPGVSVVDTLGHVMRSFGREGSGPGEFNAVDGLAVAPDGRIAIADSRNDRITLIDGESVVDEITVSGRLGGLAFDDAGHLHISRRGRIASGSGTIEVMNGSGDIARTYGEYQQQSHSLADALHNDVRFARAGDTLWWLYPYRGMVGTADGRVLMNDAPLWAQVDTLQPYVQTMGDGPAASVMITRMAAFDDIAADEGHVYLLKMTMQDGTLGAAVYVADHDGNLVGTMNLAHPAERIAVSGGRLYALRIETGDQPAIGVYSID